MNSITTLNKRVNTLKSSTHNRISMEDIISVLPEQDKCKFREFLASLCNKYGKHAKNGKLDILRFMSDEELVTFKLWLTIVTQCEKYE